VTLILAVSSTMPTPFTVSGIVVSTCMSSKIKQCCGVARLQVKSLLLFCLRIVRPYILYKSTVLYVHKYPKLLYRSCKFFWIWIWIKIHNTVNSTLMKASLCQYLVHTVNVNAKFTIGSLKCMH
jgi:hypothetical protein